MHNTKKHRGSLLGDLHILPGLIKGLSASFDMHPYKTDSVPDCVLIDEDIVVNKTYKFLVIRKLII